MNKHELLTKYGCPGLVTDLMARKISTGDFKVCSRMFASCVSGRPMLPYACQLARVCLFGQVSCQVNPDLPDVQDAWLYRVWDTSYEEHVAEQSSVKEIGMDMNLDRGRLEQFMSGFEMPDIHLNDLSSPTPEMPAEGKMPGFAKSKAGGKPKPNPKPKPVVTPEIQRKKDIARMQKTLGDSAVEVLCLFICQTWPSCVRALIRVRHCFRTPGSCHVASWGVLGMCLLPPYMF